ncbi:MAG: response regulator transcription factor [Planctomycetaceae bacterium]|nr:response regulator transcription factor [Planctomycetaceae bacterium]
MAQSLLIVEDDEGLREGLREAFEGLDYGVATCERGDVVVPQVLSSKPDVLLLDLMLPGMHGVEICKELRRRRALLPIIMLTAMADESDVIEGLRAGADDYITKPFRLNELIARVEAQLRRAQGAFGRALELPAGSLDLAQGTMRRKEGVERLTQLESEVLKFLIKERPNPVSRADLLTNVWGYKDVIATRTVDMAIAKLRAKLERDPANPECVLTVRDRGYCFEFPAGGTS